MGKKISDGKESRSVAPFLTKCYEMVDDNSTDSIISWGQNDNSFVIWDMTDFSVKLLPKYFKHSNSSSFIRQLNIYGFRKIEFDRWEFANDGFIRGQKQLLKTIARRKNSQGMDNRKSVEQQDNMVEDCEKVENEGLWKEVENLENDRNALMQELKKLRQHQEIADNNLLLLRNRIQGMEKNQQQMLSFLVMVMQNPSFLVQLLHPKENNWRVAEPGSIMEQGVDDAEPLASNGMIVRYQPSIDGMPKPAQIPATSPENPQEATSIGEMKDVFLSPDFVKVLMDDNFPSLENYAPFILPELSDDRAWEQLLLHTPFLGNVEETDQHIEEPTIAENNMEPTVSGRKINGSQSFDSFIKEFENTGNSEANSMDSEVRLENSQSMEMLSKRLGLLASENNHNDGVQ